MSFGRIFITGATGFIGARLLRKLLEQGEEIAILLRPGANTSRVHDLLGSCKHIYGSLDGIPQIKNQLMHFSPNTVIHLAWAGVENSARNDLSQLENIAYSRDLYTLTEEIGCSRFLGLGSQAEYGVMKGKINENTIPSPTSLYGLSKLATGINLNAAASSSGRPFTWLRLFSCYGPNDNPVWLIPYVINTLLNGEKPSLTKGEQIWDYLYIDDVVDGIVAALNDDLLGIYNLGSGSPVVLNEFLSTIRDLINPSLPMGFGDIDYRPDQIMHLEANMEMFFSKSNWRPSKSHAIGIPLTVSAYIEAKKKNGK